MRVDLGSCLSKLFSGDMEAFGAPPTEQEFAGHIRASQMALVLGHTPGMMLANICNAAVFAMAQWPTANGSYALIWAAAMICGVSYFGVKAKASWRVTKPQFVSQRAIQRLVRNALVFGGMWALVPIFFFADAGNGGQLVITCLCAGMLAGGAFAFATIPIAAIAFTGPIVLGTAICIGQTGEFVYLLVAVLVVVYASVLLRGVFSYSFEFRKRLIVQFETDRAVRQDPLTHLPNRFAFNERFEQEIGKLNRSGESFGLLILDLDRFKHINDQLGHPAGDEFLAEVATRLRRCARQNEFVARIGGDEFALLIPNLQVIQHALARAEQAIAALAAPVFIEGREIAASTASIGIAIAPRDGQTSNDILKHADAALYRAKKEGPGAVRFFEPADDALAAERRQLQDDLEKAIERDELFLVYQPFFDVGENRVTGFEALLRWRHPLRGLVPPSKFITIAEETGMIHPIGEWVVRQACATLSRWPKDIRIAVNFSAVQFQNASVLQTIVRALADNGVSPERFEIEITESMLISRYELALTTLKSLLSLGVTVALDDFGTGFSSLTYLRSFPFDRIKIDQSFVRDVLTKSDCAAIVKSVIGLGRDLGIRVVAEGVETREQQDYLVQIGCDEIQGYFIGRPMSADQGLALLQRGAELSIQAA